MAMDELRLRLAKTGLVGTGTTMTRVRSGTSSQVFRLEEGYMKMFAKCGPDLGGERDRLVWLSNRLPVPRVLASEPAIGNDLLILSAVPGDDLATIAASQPASLIIRLLTEALRMLHRTASGDCPFVNGPGGTTLVHGDACLPNVMVSNGSVTGFVDLGAAGRGLPETDLAAAVWSLDYNLGPGHGRAFLDAYGQKGLSDAAIERLRQSYHEWPPS
jgi:aminoglycoside phosphotransferase